MPEPVTTFIDQRQFVLGGSSPLALLDAQRQLLQAESDRVQAQTARYADTAALLHALGGGWWHPESENDPPKAATTPVASGPYPGADPSHLGYAAPRRVPAL
jgi:hypothetical protein